MARRVRFNGRDRRNGRAGAVSSAVFLFLGDGQNRRARLNDATPALGRDPRGFSGEAVFAAVAPAGDLTDVSL